LKHSEILELHEECLHIKKEEFELFQRVMIESLAHRFRTPGALLPKYTSGHISISTVVAFLAYVLSTSFLMTPGGSFSTS